MSNNIWSDIFAGIVVMVLFGGILRYTLSRMGEMENKFQTKDSCNERHGQVKEELSKGDGKFTAIQSSLIS